MAKDRSRRRNKKNTQKQETQAFVARFLIITLFLVLLIWMIMESSSSLTNIFFHKNPYFTLNKYQVTLKVEGPLTDSQVVKQQLNQILEDLEREHDGSINLFNIDLKLLRKTISQLNPQLKDVKISRSLPEGLKVTVSDRIPVARIANRKGALIDREGYILPPSAQMPYLPIILGVRNREKLQSGERSINEEIQKALELLNHLAIAPYGVIFEIFVINCSNRHQIKLTLKGNDYLKPNSTILLPVDDISSGLSRAAKIINERHHYNETTSFIDATYKVNVPIR